MGRHGPNIQTIYWTSSKTTPLDIGASHVQTLYSFTFDFSKGTDFAFVLKAVGGTINIKIELEQGAVLPTTQAAADTTNYVIPTGSAELNDSLTVTTLFIKNYSPIALKYGRLKITTLGVGSSDQALTAYLSKLEDF